MCPKFNWLIKNGIDVAQYDGNETNEAEPTRTSWLKENAEKIKEELNHKFLFPEA